MGTHNNGQLMPTADGKIVQGSGRRWRGGGKGQGWAEWIGDRVERRVKGACSAAAAPTNPNSFPRLDLPSPVNMDMLQQY